LLIKYIKSVLWRAAKRLSYIEDAQCLKVNRILKILYLYQRISVILMVKVKVSLWRPQRLTWKCSYSSAIYFGRW